jgi:hypothetical protein
MICKIKDIWNMGNYLFICSFLVFKLLHFLLSFFIKLGSICRCQHYRRRCRIRAPCCNEIFDCRHCHNEAKVSKCLILFYFLSDNICYIFLIYGCCLNDMVPSYFIFKSQSFPFPNCHCHSLASCGIDYVYI